MKNKKIIVAIFVLAIVLVPVSVLAQQEVGGGSGFELVPCGGRGEDPCTFDDLIYLIVRVINFLFAASGIVALYHVLLAGWGMMSSMGNPEKISNSKEALSRAVIGFALVLLSFAMVNLLVLGIFGLDNPETTEVNECAWWKNPRLLWNSGSCILPGDQGNIPN